jgi:hypothetical protein
MTVIPAAAAALPDRDRDSAFSNQVIGVGRHCMTLLPLPPPLLLLLLPSRQRQRQRRCHQQPGPTEPVLVAIT